MNKQEINGAVAGETVVQEGDRENWREMLNDVLETVEYASLSQVTYKVTYDNGQTVEVLAVDKFQASAEADEILVTKGYNLDDLMFSPTVEVV